MEPVTKQPRYLYRDQFLLTDDKSYVDPASVNEAISSLEETLWWTTPMEVNEMQTIIDSCLIYAVYAPADLDHEPLRDAPNAHPSPQQTKLVGFSRLITDYVSFAYLTDVFVLDAFQRKGLARWMMHALKEELDSWPKLRSLMIVTMNKDAMRLYGEVFGARDVMAAPPRGMALLEMKGKAKKSWKPPGE